MTIEMNAYRYFVFLNAYLVHSSVRDIRWVRTHSLIYCFHSLSYDIYVYIDIHLIVIVYFVCSITPFVSEFLSVFQRKTNNGALIYLQGYENMMN